jgi:nitrous oxidase accessory protein
VFDHLRGNLTAADLYAQGFAASALGAAETTFPVLAAITVEDPRPLARPPGLPHVPLPERQTRSARLAGLALSLGLVVMGGVSAAAACTARTGSDGRS